MIKSIHGAGLLATLLIFYPGLLFAEPVFSTTEQKTQLIHEAQELFAVNDCATCHKESSKVTGPAYQDVANRYYPKIRDGIITQLAEKVLKGGNRNWGFVLMTSHPNLTPEAAQKMVAAILLLADPQLSPDQKLKLPPAQ